MRKFLIIVIVIIALSLSFVLFKEGDRTKEFVPSPLVQQIQQENLVEVTLEVGGSAYEVLVPQGSTTYDLMQKAQAEGKFRFQGRDFPGLGFLVEEIQGQRQNPRQGMYWIYSINDKKAEVGVSNYILKPYDVITWKYEKEY